MSSSRQSSKTKRRPTAGCWLFQVTVPPAKTPLCTEVYAAGEVVIRQPLAQGTSPCDEAKG
eukprot:745805-Hanusia_phi.AAC.2